MLPHLNGAPPWARHEVGRYLDQMRETEDIGKVAAQGYEVLEKETP